MLCKYFFAYFFHLQRIIMKGSQEAGGWDSRYGILKRSVKKRKIFMLWFYGKVYRLNYIVIMVFIRGKVKQVRYIYACHTLHRWYLISINTREYCYALSSLLSNSNYLIYILLLCQCTFIRNFLFYSCMLLERTIYTAYIHAHNFDSSPYFISHDLSLLLQSVCIVWRKRSIWR